MFLAKLILRKLMLNNIITTYVTDQYMTDINCDRCLGDNRGVMCDDAWALVKSYMFHGKFDAIQLIEYHTGLPYTLGLHNSKGAEYTFGYLWDNHPEIFKVFTVGEVKKMINKHEAKVRLWYA